MEFDHEEVIGSIVCPHCGNQQEDTDYCAEQNYEGKEVCFECGGEYGFWAEFTIEWSTRKLPEASTPQP